MMEACLAHPNDDPSVISWLRKRGIQLDTVDDDELKHFQESDPMIRDLRQWRRIDQLLRQPMIAGDMVDPHGRAHPRNILLGAPTTRTITVDPAITGVQKELRPVVIPADGYGIGESDVASMELCIAAARYGDHQLAALCNTGHALAALAQACRPRLAGTALSDIKGTFPHLYSETKATVYGLIYGREAERIGEALGFNGRQCVIANLVS